MNIKGFLSVALFLATVMSANAQVWTTGRNSVPEKTAFGV